MAVFSLAESRRGSGTHTETWGPCTHVCMSKKHTETPPVYPLWPLFSYETLRIQSQDATLMAISTPNRF